MTGVCPSIEPTTVHYTLLIMNRRKISPQLLSELGWSKGFINNPRVEEKKKRTKERGVGKHVPPDGRYREPADPRTSSDRLRPIGKDTNVNMPKVIYV